MSPFKKYMKFENLKNCILNNRIIHSDFECTIDPVTKEHEFIAGGYYLECRNNKFSKKVQTFYNLKEYTISLIEELVYIDDIESNYLRNEIHYSNFDQQEFDNYKGKNLSRIILDIENQILQIMINYFTSKNVDILTLEYDGLKIYTDKSSKHFSINELELNIYKNIGINIKLAFKNIEDSFPDFGIRVSTDNIKNKNIIENEIKIVHHDRYLEKNNIIGYICRECNLQIKIIKLVLCISLME